MSKDKDEGEKNSPAVVDKTKSITKAEPKHGASTLAKKAPPPPGAPVDVHKMVDESNPQIDRTKGEPKGLVTLTAEEKAEKEAADAEKVEKSFKSVSDEALEKCLFVTDEDAKNDKEKKAMKGALSVGGAFGALAIPWATIFALLKSLGLPLVRPALIKVRDRVAATSWPTWIKNPIIAAIDTILADESLLTEFERRANG